MTKKINVKWKFMKLNGVLDRSYKVSDRGDIIHSSTKEPLKQYDMGKKCKKNGTDYKSVHLKGHYSPTRVHRIVCETFHGTSRSDRIFVDHIDEHKNNNKASNLKWVTASENCQAYYKNNPSVRHSQTTIAKVKKLLNKGWTNDRIAQKVGMSDSNVSQIKLGNIHAQVKPYTTVQIELGNCDK